MSGHRPRRITGLTTTLGLALLCAACKSSPNEPPAPALQVLDPSIDALSAPRHDNPLIAGEDVRIGLQVRGGTPPFSGTLTAVRQDAPLPDGAQNPIAASFDPDPEAHASNALDMALQARLHPRAPSGVYRLRATVTDARGQRTTATSGDFTLIGDDAPTLPAPPARPYVEILDVAGRRRESFVRGEAITIRAVLPGQRSADITLHDPDGAVLAHTRQPLSATGELRFTIAVPRLARSGPHRLRVTAGDATELTAPITVSSPPFAPTHELVVDDLALYGGEDLRAPRAGLLERGELLAIETRIGGGRQAATARLGLKTIAGELIDEVELGRAEFAQPGPHARVYIQGQWRVPASVAPGRYQLQVAAMEGDHVSVRYREILIR